MNLRMLLLRCSSRKGVAIWLLKRLLWMRLVSKSEIEPPRFESVSTNGRLAGVSCSNAGLAADPDCVYESAISE